MKSISLHEGISLDNHVETETGQILFIPPAQDDLSSHKLKKITGKGQCIGTLDNEFKEVIVLRDIQEFSYDEIRDILDIPEGTIKSRLFRAREAMRSCLKHKLGDIT